MLQRNASAAEAAGTANNPLRYIDPSGNFPIYDSEEPEDYAPQPPDPTEPAPEDYGEVDYSEPVWPSIMPEAGPDIGATGVSGIQTKASPFVTGGDGEPLEGTWGIGLGATGGLGGGISGSVMLVGDSKGHLAIAISGEGGGYAGVGASGGLIMQGTNAPDVSRLAGPVTQTGGSFTFGVPVGFGPNIGLEAVIQEGVMGTNLTAGGGAGTFVETHGIVGNTWLIPLGRARW